MTKLYIYIFALIMLPLAITAQEVDSTDVIDSVSDSLWIELVADSLLPLDLDSLTIDSLGIEDDSLSFEQRLERYNKARPKRKPELSIFDTLLTYYCSERFNQNQMRQRSFYHDAGDYFKFDPSYFVTEYQVTPMRKTVQPFGLPGNRLNFVIGGMNLTPFEHTLEPDGMVDLNDIPTAFDHAVYTIPGAVGQLFGARQSIASLITAPKEPETDLPETSLLGEEGSYGWSWVRGKFARDFAGGRKADMSVGYREADGPRSGRDDDSYHYYGDFYIPVNSGMAMQARGQLYNRGGHIKIRPDLDSSVIRRDRFDRQIDLSFDRHDSSYTSRYRLGYRHYRQASFLDGSYRARYNYTANSIYLDATCLMGSKIMQATIEGTSQKYDNYYDEFRREYLDASMVMADLSSGWRWAVTGGARYDDDFEFQPRGAMIVQRETERSYVLASIGYSERDPSLHERYLPYQRAEIYSSGFDDYANIGNKTLETEKQLVASLFYEYGTLKNSLSLQITAGQITDGIDWRQIEDTISQNTSSVLFTPDNGDLTFFNVTAQQRWRLFGQTSLVGGASYHMVDYDHRDTNLYIPEYQAFSGLEIVWPWPTRRADLIGYGEVLFVGPYDGYDDDLGNVAVLNMKVTLALKDFNFFLLWQNMTSAAYSPRDYFSATGRFFYYGLVWNFLD